MRLLAYDTEDRGMWMWRVALALMVMLSLMVMTASSAEAQECPEGGHVDGEGGCASDEEENETPGEDGSGSGSAASVWNEQCGHLVPYQPGGWVEFYLEFVMDEGGAAIVDDAGNLVQDPSHPDAALGAYTILCWVGGEIVAQWDYLILEIIPPVDPTVVRDRAAARIDPPDPIIGTAPSLDDGHAVVQLPTWLWVEGSWAPIHESDSEGGVSVEVAATPLYVDWRFGDGSDARCDGPGVPWSEAADAAGTYCSVTFTRSSAGQPGSVFDGSATVTWEFSWWLNGEPQGEFGTVETSTGFDVPVGEIQAVETGG
jgi:hypothetical protein